jgi:putative transposase
MSLGGKGAGSDAVFVERLWNTINYEEIYLHAHNSVSDARAGIGKHFMFYNPLRPYTEHGGDTPDSMCFGNLEMKQAA